MHNPGLYRFGAYELDAEQLILRGQRGIVALPPKALKTLLALVEREGEVVSKQQLMDAVWPASYVEEANLTQNIFLLRRELGKTAEGHEYIQTLSKRGYRMNVSVEVLRGDGSASERSLAEHRNIEPDMPEPKVQSGRAWLRARWASGAVMLLAILVGAAAIVWWISPAVT